MNSNESQMEQSQYYHVNIDRIKQLNRSPIAIIAARRGPSCPSLLESNQESLDPTKIMSEISKYCANDSDYIRNDMPIQEMMLRKLIFLMQ